MEEGPANKDPVSENHLNKHFIPLQLRVDITQSNENITVKTNLWIFHCGCIPEYKHICSSSKTRKNVKEPAGFILLS